MEAVYYFLETEEAQKGIDILTVYPIYLQSPLAAGSEHITLAIILKMKAIRNNGLLPKSHYL